MAVGSLEILFCVLATIVAGGVYWLAVVLLGRGGVKTVRTDALPVFGLPALCLVATLVTPPDTVSQMVLAIPLGMLYTLAVGIWLFVRHRKRPIDGREGRDSNHGEKA